MLLSIIIPAYNEQHRIGSTLDKISQFLKNKEFLTEIIVVDDGSVDDTSSEVSKYRDKFQSFNLIKNDKNYGKGFSVKKGFLESKGELVLFTDADLSTPIEELDDFLKLCADYDLVIASRAIQGAKLTKRQPFYREYLGRFLNIIIRVLLLKDFKDTQCGFKLFKKSSCEQVFQALKTSGFMFDLEILVIAKIMNLKIKEKDVSWANSPETKVNLFSVFDMVKSFLDIFIRYRLKK